MEGMAEQAVYVKGDGAVKSCKAAGRSCREGEVIVETSPSETVLSTHDGPQLALRTRMALGKF